ncbi:hypothetical protein K501DRAFT_328225 [Backusella circina FSU 941]|nr:hypothetical protein K501DRAFT_328225 [Backusella circina FSU 941]
MISAVYPLEGISYFFAHPKQLWWKTVAPIVLTLVFSVVSLVIAFKFLLPYQVHHLVHHHWPHWLALFASIILAIIESAIMNIVCYAVLVPFFQDAVFDATLRARGLDKIFDEIVEVPGAILCWRNFRSSLLVFWALLIIKILLLILTAPLQLIPFAGTALACYISGWPTAWSHHLHYDLEFRGLKVSESSKKAWTDKWSYTHFGAVACLLELIPILNILFVWTNFIGSALWIADVYEKEHKVAAETIYPVAQAPSTEENENAPLLADEGQGYDTV